MVPTATGFEVGDARQPCCKCQTPTPKRTALPGRLTRHQVACCNGCAPTMQPFQVPSWQAWMDLRMARAMLAASKQVGPERVLRALRGQPA